MRLLNETQAQIYHFMQNGNSYPSVGLTGFPMLDQIIQASPTPAPKKKKKSRDVVLPFQDESIIAVSIGGAEATTKDLKARNHRHTYSYSKEQLLSIKNSPLAMSRPECLDPAYSNSDGVWDPEIWTSYCKLQEATANPGQNWYFKVNPPPNPQRKLPKGRRSLDSACSISPIRRSEGSLESTRRSSSGRSTLTDISHDGKFYPSQDITMDRTFSSEDAEEPEWFVSGPTSKHDMIELRGFEDIAEEDDSVEEKTKTEEITIKDEEVVKKKGPKGRSTPTSLDQATGSPSSKNKTEASKPVDKDKSTKFSFNVNEFFKNGSWSTGKVARGSVSPTKKNRNGNYIEQPRNQNNGQFHFNFDEFFKNECWSIPGYQSGHTNDQPESSRFSQWFKKHDTPHHSQHDTSLSTSLQEDYLNKLLNISDSELDFKHQLQRQKQLQEQKSKYECEKLMEILHQNDNRNDVASSFINMVCSPPSQSKPVHNRMVSVQEVEARLPRVDPKRSKKDLSAFTNMLMNANNGQAVPASYRPSPRRPYQNPPPPVARPTMQLNQSINPMTLIHSQVLDFFKNIWREQNAGRSVVNPFYSNFGHVGQPLKKFCDDKRSPSKLLQKDSTLYHRRVKFNENN